MSTFEWLDVFHDLFRRSLGITDKTPPEIYPSKHDVRVIIKASETMYNGEIPGEHLLSHLLKGTSLQGLLK